MKISGVLANHQSSLGNTSPVENVVKKLGILGSSPYQLSQSGILGALPGMNQQQQQQQQQQQMNGIAHALNAGWFDA